MNDDMLLQSEDGVRNHRGTLQSVCSKDSETSVTDVYINSNIITAAVLEYQDIIEQVRLNILSRILSEEIIMLNLRQCVIDNLVIRIALIIIGILGTSRELKLLF